MSYNRLAVSLLAAAMTPGLAVQAARTPLVAGKATRSVVVASNGMVATSHPLAAQIGLDVLKSGGNAVDAAIATSAAMGLVEPMSCGVGGDLFAIVWDAKSKKLHGLCAAGRSPLRASIELFRQRNLDEIPTLGPLSWSVPGCVDGWAELRRKFGTRSFKELLAPSIRYAEEGVPVPEVIAGYWQGAEANSDDDFRAVYLLDGHSPRVGELFRNPALAETYRKLASGGRDAFYKGEIATKLIEFSERNGGLYSADDFASHSSEWVEPVKTNYRGYDVWELPPPGQGIAVLQMLNLLEPHDLRSLGPLSADYWYLLVESKKLAYADRAAFYADPAFTKVPVDQLISKDYAKQRAKLIDPDRARTAVPAGDPKLGRADTIYLCVVDRDRNCVSLIQSNYYGFGSGLASPELGFAIQNRGTLFSLKEDHANRLAPGKRPFHTIIPAMVTRNSKPWLTFGVMGGDMQPQGHVQVLVNLIDFGMNVQAAGDAPRIEHTGSATPTGRAGDPNGGTINAEAGIPDEVVEGLRKKGHAVQRVNVNGGGYQGILIDPATGVLQGGSESRKDGAAVGY
jgi:gamma-glutamyltranspeptidase/glutathione hydrolase